MRIEGNYLVFNDEEKITLRKITGHRLPQLLGKSKFTTRGDCLCKMFFNLKDYVDPYYGKRGAIAEDIVEFQLKMNGNDIVHFDTSFENFDMFKSNENFGGIIDLASPDFKTIYEVKGKSMNKYDWYLNNPNEEEEYQCKLYAYLKGADTAIMKYVFFNENAEMAIKENKPFSLYDIKLYDKPLNFDRDEFGEEMKIALNYLQKCYNEKRIPINDISFETLLSLERVGKLGNKQDEK